MTFRRRIEKGDSVYLYDVRSYRDKETGKVRQEVKYLGKEVDKDGEKVIRPPKDRYSVRRSLDSAAYIMYSTAVEQGFLFHYDDALQYHTRIRDAAKKILMLAAETIVGPGHSIPLHLGMQEMSDKEMRDVIELVGEKDPDIVSILERSMASDLIMKFGSSGIVYDLSAIRYFGESNSLAEYGHYYHINGENREINFVLAVTRKGGIPVHHRTMAGNVPSVSTVSSFSKEMKDYGISSVLIVMDRGFYSSQNIRELKDYDVIGALPSSLTIHDDLIHGSEDIDNSRNYMQYGEETIFHREERIAGTRYIVYFSPRLRSRRLESFYAQLNDRETHLKDLMKKKFDSSADMVRTVEYSLNGFRGLMDVEYGKESLTFKYSLKHKAIQRKTNRMGYTILFTNTRLKAEEALRIYREKDTVEKAFSHLKPHLEPFFSRSESGTRARLFLTVLGYTMVAIIAAKCDISYNQALKVMSGIREVVYSNGSHSHVEYTKEQRELIEKLKIDL